MQDDRVVASAERYNLTGTLDGQPIAICGIGTVLGGDSNAGGGDHGDALVATLIENAVREGADLALLFRTQTAWSDLRAQPPDGFEVIPATAVELAVTESFRHGAPMTLVRAGEDRDLDAIVAMGQVRARTFRFHLNRGVDFIKHAITRKRLLAGLGAPGVRQTEFVIAEEGTTAAAYLVISVARDTWTLEECGDRDPSGARVGALLQALLARAPAESRPAIRGWLPPGFVPPQVVIASTDTAPPRLLARRLSARVAALRLTASDVMFWLGDLF
jgi:hypothetical protein